MPSFAVSVVAVAIVLCCVVVHLRGACRRQPEVRDSIFELMTSFSYQFCDEPNTDEMSKKTGVLVISVIRWLTTIFVLSAFVSVLFRCFACLCVHHVTTVRSNKTIFATVLYERIVYVFGLIDGDSREQYRR
jgi:hypothetical protein